MAVECPAQVTRKNGSSPSNTHTQRTVATPDEIGRAGLDRSSYFEVTNSVSKELSPVTKWKQSRLSNYLRLNSAFDHFPQLRTFTSFTCVLPHSAVLDLPCSSLWSLQDLASNLTLALFACVSPLSLSLFPCLSFHTSSKNCPVKHENIPTIYFHKRMQ